MVLEKAKTHLLFITVGIVLCGFSLGSIVKFTDPFTAGLVTHILFYVSLFLLSLGVFTLGGMLIRQRFFYGIYIANLTVSFRQAILLAILLTGSLYLQSRALLFWWVELIFVLFIISVELFLNL